MNIQLIFCHGWAYDKAFFQKIIENIKQIKLNYNAKIFIYNLDLNFFTNEDTNYNDNFIQKDCQVIWISHSYGLIHGIINYNQYINSYIAINPVLDFSYFKANLRVMLFNIKRAKSIQEINNQLNNFYVWSQDNKLYNHHYINKKNLYIALENMLNFDINLLPLAKPTFLLIGKKDKFHLNQTINFKQIFQQQNNHIKFITGGHLLIHTNFSYSLKFIQNSIIDYLTKLKKS